MYTEVKKLSRGTLNQLQPVSLLCSISFGQIMIRYGICILKLSKIVNYMENVFGKNIYH